MAEKDEDVAVLVEQPAEVAAEDVAVLVEQPAEVAAEDVAVLVEQPAEVAAEDVAVLVEQPGEVATDHFAESTDGSDHKATLARLDGELFGEEGQQTSPSPSSSKLKCPKVPKKLLPEDARGYNTPKRISLGPYHRGKDHLAKGEALKLKFAAAYIYGSGKDLKEIYGIICGIVDELKACYDEETRKKFKDDEFTKMMLVDGCALLSYICCVCLAVDLEDLDIRYQDLSLLHQDALLLENQLPYQLLHELMMIMDPESDSWTVLLQEFFGMVDESSFQEFFGIKEKKKSFWQKMKDCCSKLSLPVIPSSKGDPEPKPELESKPCHHLLDLYRRNFLGDDEHSDPTGTEKTKSKKGGTDKKKATSVRDVKEQVMASFRNVKELMAAGIRILPSRTRYLRDISFTSSNGITAYLKLPPITIDKSTKTLFLNLIAYEMSSDIPHDFISYLRFLDSLIDHADDVKELQSAGVLQNNLGTHEEVAEFFNTVSANLDSNFHAYKDVRVKIRKHLKSHYNSKMKIWMTQCLDDYFSSPWTIIAWLGAAFALFLTAVQTYYSVFVQ